MATPSTPPSSSTASSSYIFPSTDTSSPAEEISSLPSSDSGDDDDSTIGDDGDHHGLSDAEREWRESLQQLELLLTMVVVPFVGKYFGRKAAYWGWARFMTWRYPVDIVVTDPAAFKAAGIVGAASRI